MQTSSKADTVETADRFFVMVNGQVESAEVWEFVWNSLFLKCESNNKNMCYIVPGRG